MLRCWAAICACRSGGVGAPSNDDPSTVTTVLNDETDSILKRRQTVVT